MSTPARRKLAVKLAKAHGADEKKVALVALLHDIAKELPRDRLLQIFTENAIIAGIAAQRPAPCGNGAAAAILAQTQYGVDDGEILPPSAAIPPEGPGMTKLDKIIYLADMASYERTYPEAEQLRRHALADLDRTAIEGLGLSIAWLKAGGKPVDEESSCLRGFPARAVLVTEVGPVSRPGRRTVRLISPGACPERERPRRRRARSRPLMGRENTRDSRTRKSSTAQRAHRLRGPAARKRMPVRGDKQGTRPAGARGKRTGRRRAGIAALAVLLVLIFRQAARTCMWTA